MFKILTHTLKGIRGWSMNTDNLIDISKVINVVYSKRKFKIFDREYDYTLNIEYKEFNSNIIFVPIISSGTYGIAPSQYVENSKTITKRYKTLQDVESEYNEILIKQKKLNKFMKEQENKINNIEFDK